MKASSIYARAAEKYRPKVIHTLFIAEAPPTIRHRRVKGARSETPEQSRYFYFEDVHQHDHLFRGVMEALGVPRPHLPRLNKGPLLSKFRDAGYFLIDLYEEPLPEIATGQNWGNVGWRSRNAMRREVPKLLERLNHLRPQQVVIIKEPLYWLLAHSIRQAGCSVPQEGPIYFPASGRQEEFREAIAALNLPPLA